ncbi:hypothetical protein VNG72_24530 (plasmid) [Acidiphilium acidophilum]|nr:hypothetical protein [Acidiphilium acidophilum]
MSEVVAWRDEQPLVATPGRFGNASKQEVVCVIVQVDAGRLHEITGKEHQVWLTMTNAKPLEVADQGIDDDALLARLLLGVMEVTNMENGEQ